MDGRRMGNSWSCCWHGFESRPFLNEVNEVLPLPQVVGCIFCLVQFQLQTGNELSQVQLLFLFHRIISFNKLCWILPEVKEWSTSISSFLGDVILALLIVSFYLYNNVCLREQVWACVFGWKRDALAGFPWPFKLLPNSGKKVPKSEKSDTDDLQKKIHKIDLVLYFSSVMYFSVIS